MKNLFLSLIALGIITTLSCNSTQSNSSQTEINEKQRQPLKTIEEAITYIEKHFNNPEESLWIDNSLNDEAGMNMAIIMDKLLNKKYFPNGFDQKNGYRIYKYKRNNS